MRPRPTAAPRSPWTLGSALLVALACTLLSGVSAVATAAPASAHSRLVSISPKDGETVKEPPGRVVLTFNEDIMGEFSTVKVTDAGGATVSVGDPRVDGPVVSQPLQAGLPPGGYTVVFRVVSADSHPISGRSTFTVAQSATPPPSSLTAASSAGSSTSPTGSAAASGPGGASTSGVPSGGATSSSAAPASTSTAALSPTDDTSGTVLTRIVGGLVVVLAAVALGTWLSRRQQRGQHG